VIVPKDAALANDVLNAVDWELWVKGAGLPPVTSDFST